MAPSACDPPDSTTCTRNPDGSVSDDFGKQVDPAASGELHAIMDGDVALMPPHPVAVGDEWPGDPATVARLLQLGGKETGGMTLKLLSVKSIDGRAFAEVKVSMAALKSQGGLNVKAIAQGIDLVDLATGHMVKSDLTGTVDVQGSQQAQGADGQPATYDITGHGILTVTATSPITGNTPAPMPSNGPALSPPIASPGSNPLAPAAAAPFAGTFSDDKLKVMLSSKGDAYDGTFALGAQSFPVTATASNGTLTGSFTAGGNAFNFTAALEGDTLTLTTGGTTYHLKKAVANPLDAPPPNPLAPRSDAGGKHDWVTMPLNDAAGADGQISSPPEINTIWKAPARA